MLNEWQVKRTWHKKKKKKWEGTAKWEYNYVISRVDLWNGCDRECIRLLVEGCIGVIATLESGNLSW